MKTASYTRALRSFIIPGLVAAGLLGAVPASGQTVQLTRGPYLQLGTSDGIVVRWRTHLATDSRVQFGLAPDNLVSVVDDSTSTTEHIVSLTGLSADTIYYYSIGSTTETLAGGDLGHSFRTSPLTGSSTPTRVWVLGDSGAPSQSAEDVRDAYLGFTGSTRTDLLLLLGDNAYGNGTDAEYQAALFAMHPATLAQTPVWSTLGNHDSYDAVAQTYPYFDIFTFPADGEAGGVVSGTEYYYSFDYGNIHFVVLDSQSPTPNAAMLTWLDLDLASTSQDWVIAVFHHPPYSKGAHDSDNLAETRQIYMRENALPILEDRGVDLVLTGHSHSYERSFLIDGTYGTPTPDFAMLLANGSIKDAGDGRIGGGGAYRKQTLGPGPHEGTVYAVAGSSSVVSSNGNGYDHPVMYLSLVELGSMVLDVDANILHASFLDAGGAVADSFTIVKMSCDGDGVCEFGEDCDSCPGDCAKGSGAACGNGVCEAGDGEDCLSCAADCRGKQNGKASNRFCCGDGDGENSLSCDDGICTSDGFQCTDVPVAASCCGDEVCDADEDACACSLDCGAPPAMEELAVCDDGLDNDCDGVSDCADTDCTFGLLPTGASCSGHDECCSGRCRMRRGVRSCT